MSTGAVWRLRRWITRIQVVCARAPKQFKFVLDLFYMAPVIDIHRDMTHHALRWGKTGIYTIPRIRIASTSAAGTFRCHQFLSAAASRPHNSQQIRGD